MDIKPKLNYLSGNQTMTGKVYVSPSTVAGSLTQVTAFPSGTLLTNGTSSTMASLLSAVGSAVTSLDLLMIRSLRAHVTGPLLASTAPDGSASPLAVPDRPSPLPVVPDGPASPAGHDGPTPSPLSLPSLSLRGTPAPPTSSPLPYLTALYGSVI